MEKNMENEMEAGLHSVDIGFRLLGFNCWRCNEQKFHFEAVRWNRVRDLWCGREFSCYSPYRGVALWSMIAILDKDAKCF